MSLEKDNHLLYRPNLELDKNYFTDSSFDALETEITETQTQQENEVIILKIESLKPALTFIPSKIKPATESILDLILFILTLNGEPPKDPGDEDGDETYVIVVDPIGTPPTITDPQKPDSDIDLDKIFIDGHKPKTILKQTASESVKINRLYSSSTLDVSKYYIDRLSDILANFHTQLMVYPELEEVLETVYKAPLLDNSNIMAHNILQGLLKSQQNKISKMRFYEKLYNQKESLSLLKSLEYSKLTLLKLLNQDAIPKNHKLYYKHMQIVANERHRLEKKMYEYYRYLDSSLDMLDVILNMHATEAVAKVELNTINKETEDL